MVARIDTGGGGGGSTDDDGGGGSDDSGSSTRSDDPRTGPQIEGGDDETRDAFSGSSGSSDDDDSDDSSSGGGGSSGSSGGSSGGSSDDEFDRSDASNDGSTARSDAVDRSANTPTNDDIRDTIARNTGGHGLGGVGTAPSADTSARRRSDDSDGSDGDPWGGNSEPADDLSADERNSIIDRFTSENPDLVDSDPRNDVDEDGTWGRNDLVVRRPTDGDGFLVGPSRDAVVRERSDSWVDSWIEENSELVDTGPGDPDGGRFSPEDIVVRESADGSLSVGPSEAAIERERQEARAEASRRNELLQSAVDAEEQQREREQELAWLDERDDAEAASMLDQAVDAEVDQRRREQQLDASLQEADTAADADSADLSAVERLFGLTEEEALTDEQVEAVANDVSGPFGEVQFDGENEDFIQGFGDNVAGRTADAALGSVDEGWNRLAMDIRSFQARARNAVEARAQRGVGPEDVRDGIEQIVTMDVTGTTTNEDGETVRIYGGPGPLRAVSGTRGINGLRGLVGYGRAALGSGAGASSAAGGAGSGATGGGSTATGVASVTAEETLGIAAASGASAFASEVDVGETNQQVSEVDVNDPTEQFSEVDVGGANQDVSEFGVGETMTTSEVEVNPDDFQSGEVTVDVSADAVGDVTQPGNSNSDLPYPTGPSVPENSYEDEPIESVDEDVSDDYGYDPRQWDESEGGILDETEPESNFETEPESDLLDGFETGGSVLDDFGAETATASETSGSDPFGSGWWLDEAFGDGTESGPGNADLAGDLAGPTASGTPTTMLDLLAPTTPTNVASPWADLVDFDEPNPTDQGNDFGDWFGNPNPTGPGSRPPPGGRGSLDWEDIDKRFDESDGLWRSNVWDTGVLQSLDDLR